MFSENGYACGYATNEWESHGIGIDVLLYLRKLWTMFGSRLGIFANLNRTRLIWIPFDVAGFFKLVEMRVNSRGRGQANSRAYLSNGRGIAMYRRKGADEIERLLLTFGDLLFGHVSSFVLSNHTPVRFCIQTNVLIST